PLRLAVTLGPRHAEVVAYARFGGGALLGADDDRGIAAEAADAADHGAVLGEGAVARERGEVLDQLGDRLDRMRALGMAGDQHLLPRRQLLIGLAQLALDLGLQLRHFLGDVERAVVREMLQLLDLALELGDRLLEIQELPGHPETAPRFPAI